MINYDLEQPKHIVDAVARRLRALKFTAKIVVYGALVLLATDAPGQIIDGAVADATRSDLLPGEE